MKQYINLTIILSTLGLIISSVYAAPISYPIGMPMGEMLSGTFQRYFTNMYGIAGTYDSSPSYTTGCSAGQVVRGFTPQGVLLCTTVSLTTLQYWSSADAGVSTYFTGAGNVGIGTTSPAAKLEVAGLIKSTNNGTAYLAGGDDTTLNDVNVANTVGIVGVQDATKGAIQFGSNPASYIAGSAGNVGIGTTTPGKKLEINSGIVGSGGLRFTNLTSTSATGATNGKTLTVNGSGDVILVDSPVVTSANMVRLYNEVYSAAAGKINNTSGYSFVVATSGRYLFDFASTSYASNAAKTTTFAVRNGTTVLASDADTSFNNLVHVEYSGKMEVDLVAGTTYNVIVTDTGVKNSGDWDRVYYKQIAGFLPMTIAGSGADLPVGSIMAFNLSACPTGWVIADGSSGAPDLRGEFIRGLDSGRGVDTGRIIGSAQGGATRLLMNGASTTSAPEGNSPSGIITHKPAIEMIGTEATFWGTFVQRISLRSAMDTTWGGGSETRPRNVALLYCMKLTSNGSSPSNNVTWTNVTGTSSGNVALATTGNVGIGTTAPSQKLEVAGNAVINAGGNYTNINIGSDANDSIFADNTAAKSYGGGLWFRVQDSVGSYTDTLRLAENGNIGIGINPTAKLDVAGQIRTGRDGVTGAYDSLTAASTQSIWSISPTYDLNGAASTAFGNLYGMSYSYQGNGGLAGFGHQIGFHDNGGRNAAISLTNGNAFFNGNVGIGISAPTSKLDVNGPIKALGSSIWAQSNNTSTSYADAPLQVREAMYGADAGYLAPRIGLHWGGVIASQIGLESTGRIAILNNPGTGYENFVAKDITVARLMANSSTLIGFANNVAYDIGAGRIAAGQAIYSYGSICAGNALGTCADPTTGFVATANTFRLGTKYFRDIGDGWIRMGDSVGDYNGMGFAAGNLFTTGNSYAGAFIYTSDIRLKQNIAPLSDSLSKVLSLNGYSFDWKKDGKHDIGVIAQEVEKVFPALVGINPITGMKGVEYGNLVAPLIEAIKELAGNVRSNTAEIQTLKSENVILKARLDAIEARLAK